MNQEIILLIEFLVDRDPNIGEGPENCYAVQDGYEIQDCPNSDHYRVVAVK